MKTSVGCATPYIIMVHPARFEPRARCAQNKELRALRAKQRTGRVARKTKNWARCAQNKELGALRAK
ncbi:MAG: hypothetical protein ACK59C_07445 [Holosporales bacterium]